MLTSGHDSGISSETPEAISKHLYQTVHEVTPKRITGKEVRVYTGMPSYNDNVLQPESMGMAECPIYIFTAPNSEKIIETYAYLLDLVPEIIDVPDVVKQNHFRHGVIAELDDRTKWYIGRSYHDQYLVRPERTLVKVLDQIIKKITYQTIGSRKRVIKRVGYADYDYDADEDEWTPRAYPYNVIQLDHGRLKIKPQKIQISKGPATFWGWMHALDAFAMGAFLAQMGFGDMPLAKATKFSTVEDYNVGNIDTLAWTALKLEKGGLNKTVDMAFYDDADEFQANLRQRELLPDRQGYNELCFEKDPVFWKFKWLWDAIHTIACQLIGGLSTAFVLKTADQDSDSWEMKTEFQYVFKTPYTDGASSPWLQPPNNYQPEGVLLPYTVQEAKMSESGIPSQWNKWEEVFQEDTPGVKKVLVDRGRSETIDRSAHQLIVFEYTRDGEMYFTKPKRHGYWTSKYPYYPVKPDNRKMVAWLMSYFSDMGADIKSGLAIDGEIFDSRFIVPIDRTELTIAEVVDEDGKLQDTVALLPTQDIPTSTIPPTRAEDHAAPEAEDDSTDSETEGEPPAETVTPTDEAAADT